MSDGLFTVHALLVALTGTGGVLLVLAGLGALAHPRRIWTLLTQRHAGRASWYRSELAIGRRAFFWVPADITLDGPEDVYVYVLSDRFWASWLGWAVRALCWYAGALLIFFGLFVLGVGVLALP